MTAFRAGFLVLAAFLGSSPAFGLLRLDESFGSGGTATAYSRDAGASAMVLAGDGKIVEVGSGDDDFGHSGVLLVRLTSAGALDASFGTGGLVELFAPPLQLFANAVSMDSAGRIVVAGSAFDATTGHFLLARFLPDGSPDASFGTGGLVVTKFPGRFATASSLAIETDGKIVVGGGAATGVAGDFAAARYGSDGGLDAGFGSGGLVVLDLGGSFYEFASAVVSRSDGRITLGGRTDGVAGAAMALVQLLSDGSLDPSFGTGGRVVLSGAQSTECNALSIQPDGRLVAAGPSSPPSGSVVVRLMTNGSLDPAFGAAGVASVAAVTANGVAIDGAGRIALGGTALGSMAVTRLLPNGAADPGIGPGGYAHVFGGSPPNFQARGASIAIGPDGGIVIAGDEVLEVLHLFATARFADGVTAPIPTLSGLGLAILGMGLALAAALVLRRS